MFLRILVVTPAQFVAREWGPTQSSVGVVNIGFTKGAPVRVVL